MKMILRVSAYFIVLLLLFIVSVVIIVNKGIFSENLGPGEISGKVNTQDFVIDKKARQELARQDLNISIVKNALHEGWISKRSLTVLFFLGGFLFWLFEQFGPFPMVTVLLTSYLWITFETFRS